MCEESFWTLFKSGSHWAFEIFLMILFDGVILAIIFPFAKKHILHHLARDAKEGNK
jgi:hypothetical protein